MLIDIFVNLPNYERAYASEMVKKTLQEAHAIREHTPNVIELELWYTNNRGMLGNRKPNPMVRCVYIPHDATGIPLSEHIVGQYYGTYEYKFTPRFQNELRRTFKISSPDSIARLHPGTEGPDGRRYMYMPQMSMNPNAYIFIPYQNPKHLLTQSVLCMSRYDKARTALDAIYEDHGEPVKYATFSFMYMQQ